MPHESGLTCIHAAEGLCPSCQADFDEDPCAYIEFGQHTVGITRMQALEAEMGTREPEETPADLDLPF